MKYLIPFSILFYTLLLYSEPKLFAQDPIVQWDNTIGGTSSDFLAASAETIDGGYILVGYSSSLVGYDKTEYVGNYDYWIVKLNAIGTIEWQNTIGTSVADYVTDVVATPDGGYLVGGYTTGGISGDKTDAAVGSYDFWILKLAPTGEIVWQKTIGGTGDDKLTDILPLVGGGFVLSGYSSSGISGNKTEACIGGYDYWIMKINNTGSILWQFTIGGTANDYLKTTIKSADGNYVLAGYSSSGISGHKSEANIGSNDYWVLAIDGAGTVVWQNTLGGTGSDYLNSICELNIGGFILGGRSSSNASADKSENSLNYLDYCWVCEHYTSGDGSDYWIVRINEIGEVIWENSYLTGGEWSPADVDEVFQYADNKIMIAGNAGGYGENLESDGGNDYWLVTIDTNGYIVRQQVLGGEITWVYDEYDWIVENGDNYLRSCFVTADGGFFVAGSSNGLAGNDKSESEIGGYENHDYWIVKIGPDTCTPAPIYADFDRDGEGGDLLANTCELTDGPWVSNANDCNDLYSSIKSTGTEICDNLDNDCDGLIDEGLIDCNAGPEIAWNKTLGNANYNILKNIVATSDGGSISIGSTSAVSPETDYDYSPDFNYDVEIYKLDAAGNIQWQKIITADNEDIAASAIQTPDGGYLIGISSNSGISGDKTLVSFGGSDYWLIKLNNVGAIEWQKVYGGLSNEYLTDMEITADGGVIIAGHSYSGVSGNKTESTYGSYDYWILKLNAVGDIEWQNGIGGASNDDNPTIAIDIAGNYYIGGQSTSGISGVKTEVHIGNNDYWALKLNSFGEIIWQNTIGGSSTEQLHAIDVNDAGEMILAGNSSSGVSVDKTEPSTDFDYWIVKLNLEGTISWQNTITGTGADYCRTVKICPDGGYLVGGYSLSIATADKTESYHKPMFNYYGLLYEDSHDFWILKLDHLGAITWQNTIGGNMGDYLVSIDISSDQNIYLGGYSKSSKSGDKSDDVLNQIQEVIEIDNYSDDEWTEYYPNTDFWIVQLQPENCAVIDELCNTLDDNCNGLIDDDVIETVNIVATGPTTFCQGGNVVLNATASGPNYQWKRNGINIVGATASSYTAILKGTYTCETISDCGSGISEGIFVNAQKNPSAIINAAGPTTFCVGESVTLSANAGAGLSYQWFIDGVTIAGATSINYTATLPGVYKCSVTKTATGCYKNSNAITVTVPCKAGEFADINLIIYPNPATEFINIQTNSSNFKVINIIDALGSLIITKSATENVVTLNTSNLPAGVYFIQVVEGDVVSKGNFVKQ